MRSVPVTGSIPRDSEPAGALPAWIVKTVIAGADRRRWTRWPMMAALFAVVSCLGAFLEFRIAPTNLAMLYLVGVVFTSYRWGFGPAAVFSVAGTLVFDFFFIPPYRSFAITDVWYSITALALLGIALLTSVLTSAVRQHAFAASRREAQTAALYNLNQSLMAAHNREEILRAAATHIRQAFGVEIAVLLTTPEGELKVSPPGAQGEVFMHAAQQAFRSMEQDGSPRRRGAFVPLRTAHGLIGLIALLPQGAEPHAGHAGAFVLEAISAQVASAIERLKLEQDARQAEVLRKADELQRSLLNSISHSLRAPLAAILSAVDSIAEGAAVEASVSIELARVAHDEATRLDTLIGNMLDMSRLEAGALRPNAEPNDIRDVIGAALRDFKTGHNREVGTNVGVAVPPVMIDFPLIVHVLINLLDNAVKYSPAGSPVSVEAFRSGDEIEVRVADSGSGVSAAERDAIFRRFARGSAAAGTSGIGLGLPICKGFIQAHKGRIWVEERPGGGSLFCFTLPVAAVRDRASHPGGVLRETHAEFSS